MSHITVLIAGNNIKEQMEKFANVDSNPFSQYIISRDITQKIREEFIKSQHYKIKDFLEDEYGFLPIYEDKYIHSYNHWDNYSLIFESLLDDRYLRDKIVDDSYKYPILSTQEWGVEVSARKSKRELLGDDHEDTSHRTDNGYIILNKGQLVKAIKRINPKEKYNYFNVSQPRVYTANDIMRFGGGYFLETKSGVKVGSDLVKNIDFKKMISTFNEYSGLIWDTYNKKYGHLKNNYKPRKYFEELGVYKHPFTQYLNQESVKALLNLRNETGYDIDHGIIHVTKEDYIYQNGWTTYAFIKNGNWHEIEYEIGSKRKKYYDEFYEFINGIQENETISILDCHE